MPAPLSNPDFVAGRLISDLPSAGVLAAIIAGTTLNIITHNPVTGAMSLTVPPGTTGALKTLDIDAPTRITTAIALAFETVVAATTSQYWRITNSGSAAFFGVESSAGGVLIVGSPAYDTVIRGSSGLSFSADAGGTLHVRINANGGISFRQSAMATAATTGHFTIPSSAGAPTGVPAGVSTGQIAMQFDSTNNFLYAYLNGAWKKTTVFA